MTNAEMNRRLSEMKPEAVAKIKKMHRDTSYTARELHGFRIPGAISLAHINACFKKAWEEA